MHSGRGEGPPGGNLLHTIKNGSRLLGHTVYWYIVVMINDMVVREKNTKIGANLEKNRKEK